MKHLSNIQVIYLIVNGLIRDFVEGLESNEDIEKMYDIYCNETGRNICSVTGEEFITLDDVKEMCVDTIHTILHDMTEKDKEVRIKWGVK